MLDFLLHSPGFWDIISFTRFVQWCLQSLLWVGFTRQKDWAHKLSLSPPFVEFWGFILIDHRSVTSGNHF